MTGDLCPATTSSLSPGNRGTRGLASVLVSDDLALFFGLQQTAVLQSSANAQGLKHSTSEVYSRSKIQETFKNRFIKDMGFRPAFPPI